MKKVRRRILVIINNSWGEVDWILPVLNQLHIQHKAQIWIHLQTDQLLSDAEQFRDLFMIMSQISAHIFVPAKLDSLMSRRVALKRYLTSRRRIRRVDILVRGIMNILSKRFSVVFTQEEMVAMLLDNHVDVIMHDYGGGDYTAHYRELPDANIVVFPHGTLPFHLLMPDVREKLVAMLSYKTVPKGSLVLSGNVLDADCFRNIMSQTRVKPVGCPKYDGSWIGFLSACRNDEDAAGVAIRVLLLMVPHRKVNGAGVYREYVQSVIKLVGEMQGELYIKLHPRQDRNEVISIVGDTRDVRVHYVTESILNAAQNMDMAIAFPTSGCMDAVRAGCPVIEFFNPENQTWTTLIKDEGQTTTIYRKLNLVMAANSEDQLWKSMRDLADSEKRRIVVQSQKSALRDVLPDVNQSSIQTAVDEIIHHDKACNKSS